MARKRRVPLLRLLRWMLTGGPERALVDLEVEKRLRIAARKRNLGRPIGPPSKPYCLTCGLFGHFDADCPVRNRRAPGPDDDQHRSVDP